MYYKEILYGKVNSLFCTCKMTDQNITTPIIFSFSRLYLEQNDSHEKFTGDDVCVDRSSESVTCQTFELTLRSCLYPHIDKQYLKCCGNLMQTLKKDYR